MKRVIIGILCLGLGGCASIIHGSKQKVLFNTEPPGAEVKISLLQKCITPCFLYMKRNDSYSAMISRVGFNTETLPIEQKISGWVFGNLLTGGIIGLGVDVVVGGAWNLEPSDVSFSMTPSQASVKTSVVTEPAK